MRLPGLSQEHPELRRVVPDVTLKEEAEDRPRSSGEGLAGARDPTGWWTASVAQLEEYRLLERLLREQCVVGNKRDGRPGEGDDDAGEGAVPITLRDPKEVRSDSLQSPHDPEATYSGHKGKGYEVPETCHAENATQLITHVEVTPSSGSDTRLCRWLTGWRSGRSDRTSSSRTRRMGRNAFEASRRGTELVSPVAGSAPGNPTKERETDRRRSLGRTSRSTYLKSRSTWRIRRRVEVHFARDMEPCPLRSRCPVSWTGVRGPTSSRRTW